MSAAELERTVLSLPAGERRALADLLEASLDAPADPAWIDAWNNAAARRLAELRDGRATGLSAGAVLQEVRDALRTCA